MSKLKEKFVNDLDRTADSVASEQGCVPTVVWMVLILIFMVAVVAFMAGVGGGLQ